MYKKLPRVLRLLKLKLYRIRDFPEALAIGLAWGASVSMTPMLGFHLITCYLGTWIMRGNIVAATVGTVVGNPWTFPFFFYLDYKVGTLFFFKPLDEYNFSIGFFVDNFEKLFFPTLIGSIPIAIATWFITYIVSKKLLNKRFYDKQNKIGN